MVFLLVGICNYECSKDENSHQNSLPQGGVRLSVKSRGGVSPLFEAYLIVNEATKIVR